MGPTGTMYVEVIFSFGCQEKSGSTEVSIDSEGNCLAPSIGYFNRSG